MRLFHYIHSLFFDNLYELSSSFQNFQKLGDLRKTSYKFAELRRNSGQFRKVQKFAKCWQNFRNIRNIYENLAYESGDTWVGRLMTCCSVFRTESKLISYSPRNDTWRGKGFGKPRSSTLFYFCHFYHKDVVTQVLHFLLQERKLQDCRESSELFGELPRSLRSFREVRGDLRNSGNEYENLGEVLRTPSNFREVRETARNSKNFPELLMTSSFGFFFREI